LNNRIFINIKYKMMKKLLSIFGIVLLFASFGLTSCSSNTSLCPAYPPSTYNGEIQKQTNKDVNIEVIEIEDTNNL